MKILITSGGTREYIDDVRVLTNISTGKLGATIVDELISLNIIERHREPVINFEVHYVFAKGAIRPNLRGGFYNIGEFKPYEVTDVSSLMKVMEELVPQMDVVIHAMAVSDFGFIPTHTKLKSNDPQTFIDSLRDRIIINPKVTHLLKNGTPQ